MATSVIARLRPRAVPPTLGGGLLAGLLDGTDAILYFGLLSGVSADRIFRYIASGLIGIHAAVNLGPFAVILGLILHFTIAVGPPAVYYIAALKFSFLIRPPFLSGTVFGLGLYFFMNYIVVPLSDVPKQPLRDFSWIDLA